MDELFRDDHDPELHLVDEENETRDVEVEVPPKGVL